MLRRFRLFSTKDNYQQVNMFGPCDTPMYRLKKKRKRRIGSFYVLKTLGTVVEGCLLRHITRQIRPNNNNYKN